MSGTEILIKAAQLILSLSILVILHEMGHFVTAKIFKCRVEKFFLFFDPWFALFKKKVGETEYGVGWLPLGGYVKISGMVDESMDKEQLKEPPKPWEFRSKPAWQRLVIMVAGVVVNVLLAFFLFAMVLWVWGEKKMPMSSLHNGVMVVDSLAYDLGFRNGDRIEAVNGQPVRYFEDLMPELIYAQQVTVQRNDSVVRLEIPHNLFGQLIKHKSRQLFIPRMPAIVDEIPDTSLAGKEGLTEGDRIIAVNGKATPFLDQLKATLDSFSNGEVTVTVTRQTGKASLNRKAVMQGNNPPAAAGGTRQLHMKVSGDGTLGFLILSDPDELSKRGVYTIETKKYGFLEAFPAGISLAVDRLQEYVRQFKLIFQPSTGAYKGLGGFGTIAKVFAPTWDWQVFWTWTAFLSIILAFMNILPIPALDGGHALFLLVEMVTGRRPSDKFLEYAQIAGMIILFGLMLFANGMDVWRGIEGWFGH